jgi:prepilin signal peptidase PulO-like enzyme (type II secretory pathway)
VVIESYIIKLFKIRIVMDISETQVIGTAIAFILGLLFGSFATMASHRIPLGEELIITPSHCPKCNHRLGFLDLFPVFSWVFNKGKCHYCKANIHFRYPATELLMASAFATIYWKFGFTLECLSLLMMSFCTIIMLVIQLEKNIIPNLIIVAMIPCGILYKYAIDVHIYEYFLSPIVTFLVILSLNKFFALFKSEYNFPRSIIGLFVVVSIFISTKNIAIFLLLPLIFTTLNSYLFLTLRNKLVLSTSLSLIMSLILNIFIG